MARPSSTDHTVSLWERGFTLVVLAGILLIIGVSLFGYYFQQRRDSIEGQPAYAPVGSYKPPDLEAMVADEMAQDAIAIEQSVYVPVYSHVYFQRGRPYLLETTLSIRNTDQRRPLFVRSVRYYDTHGELIKTPVDRLIKLKPLQTIEILIERRDSSGGSGANFIVDWLATESINPPIIETVMVGAAGSYGLSFRAEGQSLE